jgi:hypothetical protein
MITRWGGHDSLNGGSRAAYDLGLTEERVRITRVEDVFDS